MGYFSPLEFCLPFGFRLRGSENQVSELQIVLEGRKSKGGRKLEADKNLVILQKVYLR